MVAKLGTLKAIGHNIADSMASGIGLLIGMYGTDIFREASANEPGYINVDFLRGTGSGSPVSPSLAKAITLYTNKALPHLCECHGVELSDFATLEARFGLDSIYGPHFTVTVEHRNGKRSVDRFAGIPGRRFGTRRNVPHGA